MISSRVWRPHHVPPDVHLGSDTDRDVHRMVSRYAECLERHVQDSPLAWEHWLAPAALDSMTPMLDRTLRDRYRM